MAVRHRFHPQRQARELIVPRTDNTAFYNATIRRHGLNARGVHWNSEKTQILRFEVLASLIPRDLGALSIVDAGCGFGDFFLYLESVGRQPGRYVGLDIMAPMVEEAQQRTGREVYLCDVMHDTLITADYYVCSGALNILTRFETQLFLTRCYEHARNGFVFNMLEGEDESMVYNYYSDDEIRRIGHDLGAEVVIRRGYLDRDMTVAFYKSCDIL
jgi:SAM-dependent methyltransferase